jgi:hypothetical protein
MRSMRDAVQGRDTSVRDIISKGHFVQGVQHPRTFVGDTSAGDTSTLHRYNEASTKISVEHRECFNKERGLLRQKEQVPDNICNVNAS